MSQWLSNYAFKTKINIWFFTFSMGVAAIIVVITVTIHSLKVAKTNPVEALRYE
jgi:ABC-type lipoprotein release transport system permease subunit